MSSPVTKTAHSSPVPTPSLADRVIAATGPRADARLAQLLPSLVRHLHAFALESNLTVAEWMAGVEFINACGRMSDDKRNETQLLCDILGLESLVDGLASAAALTAGKQGPAQDSQAKRATSATPSAILGPFYRHGAPVLPCGSCLVRGIAQTRTTPDEMVLFRGVVRDAETGLPLPAPPMDLTNLTDPQSAVAATILDVWHASNNGLYEQQDPEQPDMNLRGRIVADAAQGSCYSFYTQRSAPYPIPDDGPAGQLLGLLDRQPFRPAHVHFIVSSPGFQTLTTQLFDSRDAHLHNDSVFAVKDPLVVMFQPLLGDPQARWVLEYDFSLIPEKK